MEKQKLSGNEHLGSHHRTTYLYNEPVRVLNTQIEEFSFIFPQYSTRQAKGEHIRKYETTSNL